MRLEIRYENEVQTLELDAEATNALWFSLFLEDEDELSDTEREERIQDEFDEKINKPEYNIWHRETRHIDPTPKRKRMDGRTGYIKGDPDDASFDIMDYLATINDDKKRELKFEYEDVCTWIRKTLSKKPEWAEAFIAVRINDESVREYAARVGESENNITQKLKRAAKKLKENYKNRQI